jgi:hypothetical protein
MPMAGFYHLCGKIFDSASAFDKRNLLNPQVKSETSGFVASQRLFSHSVASRINKWNCAFASQTSGNFQIKPLRFPMDSQLERFDCIKALI